MFDINSVDDRYEKPFFELLFERHPDWKQWTRIEPSDSDPYSDCRAVIRFPNTVSPQNSLVVIANGAEVIVCFRTWHTHESIFEIMNLPVELWDALDELELRVESGEVDESVFADFQRSRAIEYIESLYFENKLLWCGFNGEEELGGSWIESSQVSQLLESIKDEAKGMRADAIYLFSAQGTYDQVIHL